MESLNLSLKTIFLQMALFGIVISCNNSNEYQKERKEILNKIPFDKTVISSINQYDSIRSVLITNLKNLIIRDKKECWIIYNYDDNKFSFNFNIDQKNRTHLPDSLNELEKVFRNLGEKKIQGLYLNRDSSIRFIIRNTYIAKYRTDIREQLFWPNKNRISVEGNNPYAKDTLINNYWKYSIWVDRRYGW